MLYSYKGNYPQTIPNRIRLSNGQTRTDSSTFTIDELLDAGWVAVDNPPEVSYPQKLDWSTASKQWFIRDPTIDEITNRWEEIRYECVRRLAATDYKVIKAVESGNPIDQEIIAYRQQLRDIYNNINNIDPWNVVWPELPQNSEGQQ